MSEQHPHKSWRALGARLACRLLVVLALAAMPISAGAVIIHVPSDYPTIQAGINAASPGDMVLVACGTYYEHDLQMKSGIELRSESGSASCVTIDVAGYPGGIWCHSLNEPTRIVGFTITGASSTGIYLERSYATIENCTFLRNVATQPWWGGAGVTCVWSAPLLISCRFERNEVPGYGGGLSSSESNPELIDCVFERNRAHGGGGAFFNEGFPRLTRCTFTADSAWAFGGGIHCFQSTPRITDCDFHASWADSGGGGLILNQSAGVLQSCSFTDNAASLAGGGGASFVQSYATLLGCSFSGNVSAGAGGGAQFGQSHLEVSSCTFTGNSGGGGGGVEAGRSVGTVVACLFSGNTASSAAPGGGGLHSGASAITIQDSVFEDNAALRGGGISFRSAMDSRAERCTFLRNNAEQDGGGVSVRYGTPRDPVLLDCLFEENSAGLRGGGLACNVSWPTITTCVFTGNTTDGVGGGLVCEGYSDPLVTSCTFVGNSAMNGGGGIASTSDSYPTLRNCIIAYSTTGLAVQCDATSSVTFSCSDLYGNIGGDWVGCAAGQEGVSGNFSEAPLFCDYLNGDFHLAENSPCANAPGCGLVGALPVGCGPLAVGDPLLDLTRRVILGPSVPNPFRESAEIRYVLAASSDPVLVRLDIYGADGRLVRRLVNEPRQPGIHAARWDGKDDGGQRLPSGIYFGRLRVGGGVATARMVLLE